MLGAWLACLALPAWSGTAVYRWVDANGVVHLSSDRPPAGVQYERLNVPTTGAPTTTSKGSATTHVAAASSAEQVARRNEAVAQLQNRECVVALESIDRMNHGATPADPIELRRLQQTADQNCSRDPARRSEQVEMAARLRVAKGDVCVDARNKLADMLEPGRKPTRDQLKVQQEFIETYCSAPVR